MKGEFTRRVEQIPTLFQRLVNSELRPLKMRGHPVLPGIYILFEENLPVHVGRTRNIRRRLQDHCVFSHNSASFAFKRTRNELGRKATYTVDGSRSALQEDEVFGARFREQIKAVAAMQVRYLQVDDHIDQYLLELYATLECELPSDEFDTH